MKRIKILAALLCALGMALPVLSFAALPDGECKAGWCAAGSLCPDGSLCHVASGQSCGHCDL